MFSRKIKRSNVPRIEGEQILSSIKQLPITKGTTEDRRSVHNDGDQHRLRKNNRANRQRYSITQCHIQ